MGNEIRINRAQPTPQKETMSQAEEDPAAVPQTNPNSKMPWVILGVVVVVIAALSFLFRAQLFKNAGYGGAVQSSPAKASGYQAIFLTNGQVYFGKISNPSGDYVTLKDIYYLQVGPQQGSGTNAQGEQPQAQQSVSLVKLGNELHGPVDEMHISRSQVLFYEDLKSEGSVVKAIDAYKANPNGTPLK